MEQRIKDIMASVFEISPEIIHEDISSDEIEKWDSLHHMNLIAALEEEFEIEFEEEEILDLLNFRLIKLSVEEKVNG